MLNLELKYLGAVLSAGNVATLLEQGGISHLFRQHPKAIEFVHGFALKYGKLPSFEAVLSETGLSLTKPADTAEYYRDKLRDVYVDQELRQTITKVVQQHLDKGGDELPDPNGALTLMAEEVMKLTAIRYGADVFDLRDAIDMVTQAFIAKKKGETELGIELGWPTLDAMTAGLTKGDLISFASRPGMGKTYMLLWAAIHAWKTQGKVPLFISMEVAPLPILQRITGIFGQLPVQKLQAAQLGSMFEKKLSLAVKQIKGHDLPFYVVDGKLAANVEDCYALVRQLNPGLVIIDGAYLLRHPSERDRYKRVAENAEMIKSLICPLAPTIASWQFKRGEKKMKGPKLEYDLEDIGSSDAIGQVSSLVLAITGDDSIENVIGRRIKVIKGRNGEDAEFRVRWDFEWTTDFSELLAESVADFSDEDV